MSSMLALVHPTHDDAFAGKIPDRLCNLEAEALLLGALMNENCLIDQAADLLSPDDFYEPLHSRIFEAVVQQYSTGRSATPVSIKHLFDAPGDPISAVGGVSYLARLTGQWEAFLGPREIMEQIAELAKRRRMFVGLRQASDACADLDIGDDAIVSSVDTAMQDRRLDTAIESDAADTMQAMLADLDKDHVGVLNHRIGGIDELVGALEPKSLTILAARPGMGKTAVATNYALGAARAGHGVCFVSLEMSREQLAGRMIADVGFDDADRRVPYAAIQKRDLNSWQRDRVNEIAKWVAKLPLSVIDVGTLTMGRLDRIIRRQKRRMAASGVALELIVIDYLQLLHCDERKRSAYEAISEISTRLKGLAKDHGVAILALAQLSRVVETRADKRPILSDLRDSGQIEQDADAVLFLLREEYYLRQAEPQNDPDEHDKWQAKLDRCFGSIEFILAKRRNGTTGAANGKFYGAYQAVR